MTTSGSARETEPSSAANGQPQAKPADDVQQLRREIDQTREQLGETVGQLVAKADVKARAQDRAAALAGRMKSALSQGASNAREHRVPLAMVAGVLVVGFLVIRWRTRR